MRSAREGHVSVRSQVSHREAQILSGAAQGLTDKAISQRLGISLATVGTYWSRIRTKVGPMSRTELVANWLREETREAVGALRNENRHMIEQIEQHSKTQAQLVSDLNLLKVILETAPDAILLVDHLGIIRLSNRAARELFGFAPQDLVGHSVEEFVPNESRAKHVLDRKDYLEHPVRKNMGEHLSTHALHRDGSRFPIAAALATNETHLGRLVTCIIRDLTPWLESRLDKKHQAEA